MTKIEWTHIPGYKGETWNPVVGCEKIAPGCKNCYAKALHDKRHKAYLDHGGVYPKNGKPMPAQYAHPFETVQTVPERLDQPLRWRKPRCVFVNSMSDLFHEAVPFEFIDKVYAVMLASAVLNNRPHMYLILTKRPERMHAYFDSRMPREHVKAWAEAGNGIVEMDNKDVLFSEAVEGAASLPKDAEDRNLFGDGIKRWTFLKGIFPLPNVWHGVSIATQADADKNIPVLLQVPSAKRFISAEPQIRPVYLQKNWLRDWQHDEAASSELGANVGLFDGKKRLDWVIQGGESGRGARPFDIAWARSMRDQCKAAGVPFFLKQLGSRPYELVTNWAVEDDTCQRCGGRGQIVTCPDDMCHGQEECIHGDGYSTCPECGGDGHEDTRTREFWTLKDRKGGDPEEWPEDLRVREWPATNKEAARG